MVPQATLIANPHAGGGRARSIARESVVALNELGIQTRLLLPDDLESLREEVTQTVVNRTAPIIACGGDGTVHQVLQAVAHSGALMSVIPAGTGNDIARTLGIRGKARDQWLNRLSELIRSGQESHVDLSRITHGDRTVWSLGVISAGFDSAVNERADRMGRLRGTPRYVAALLAELGSFRMREYELVVDGVQHSGPALLIAVGNGESYGGGMRICPSADMRDGLLDVTWIDPAPRRTVLRVFPRIYSGDHVRHPLVRTFRGREISIVSTGAMVYADGERVGEGPVSIRVIPDALRILRP